MNIGTRFSSALGALNVKSKELVYNFDISQQYVSNLKKADKLNDTIAKIADHYKINLNWLLSGKGNMFISLDTQVNNLQNSNIAGSGVDNSQASKHTFNNYRDNYFIPDYILDDLNILFKRAKGNEDNLIDAIDDFIASQKKMYRQGNK